MHLILPIFASAFLAITAFLYVVVSGAILLGVLRSAARKTPKPTKQDYENHL